MNTPYAQFAAWLEDARAKELNDAEAFALSTVEVAADGSLHPDVRVVLLKGFDAQGFVFFTNYTSAKGRQLAANPVACLNFHWKSLRRQVRAQGQVEQISAAESDAYFATRVRASQLSAHASLQSQPLEARAHFEARLAEMDRRYPDVVPRPAHWGGYRIKPDWIEFWDDRAGRQHHRERHVRTADGWEMGLLYP